MPTIRVSLLTGISTRDSTQGKDARSQNTFAEKDEITGQLFVGKRPGLSSAIATFAAGPGQGVFGFVDATGTPTIYSIANDILYSYGSSGPSNTWVQL